MKKGNRSWKPATQLATFKKDPKFVYRYIENTPERIARVTAEHWEPVNRSTDPAVTQDTGQDYSIDGALSHRELKLFRMPKDMAEARNRYFQEQTDKQELGIKERLQKEMAQGGDARAEGSIIID